MVHYRYQGAHVEFSKLRCSLIACIEQAVHALAFHLGYIKC